MRALSRSPMPASLWPGRLVPVLFVMLGKLIGVDGNILEGGPWKTDKMTKTTLPGTILPSKGCQDTPTAKFNPTMFTYHLLVIRYQDARSEYIYIWSVATKQTLHTSHCKNTN